MRACKRWIYLTSLAAVSGMILFLILHMNGFMA